MFNADKPDDGDGDEWDYRVVSWPDTEPDAPRDQRYLAIHHVDYHRRHYRNHRPGDVGSYDYEAAEVSGASIPELLLTLERMQRAVDRPAVIAAEHPTTTTHAALSADAPLRVSAEPAETRCGTSAHVDIQLEEHLVQTLRVEQAQELLRLLQAALAELNIPESVKGEGSD